MVLDSSCEQVLARCKTALLAKHVNGIHKMHAEDTESIVNHFTAWWDKSRQGLWSDYNPAPPRNVCQQHYNPGIANENQWHDSGSDLWIGSTLFYDEGRSQVFSAAKELLGSLSKAFLTLSLVWSLVCSSRRHLFKV
jgi:hypothetical protein